MKMSDWLPWIAEKAMCFPSGELAGLSCCSTVMGIDRSSWPVIGFTTASFQSLSPQLSDLLRVLGASRIHTLWLLAHEARLGLLASVMAAFGAIVSEVGASMTVGGNLERGTRVLTTAIVTETSRGEVERALALGVVLLALSLAVNVLLTVVQQRNRP